MALLGLVVLLTFFASGCRDRSDAGEGSPSASALPGPPPPLPRAKQGSGLVREPASGALLLADPERAVLWWIGEPEQPAATAKPIPMPGPPVRILALRSHVLVAINEPSLLLLARPDARRGLVERTRIPLPAGAWGLAATVDEQLALVTSTAAAKVTAVSIAEGSVRWTVAVAPHPRDVVIQADAALITHLIGGQITLLSGITVKPASRTLVLPPAAPPQPAGPLLDGLAALGPRGRRVFVAHQHPQPHGGIAGGRRLDVLSATAQPGSPDPPVLVEPPAKTTPSASSPPAPASSPPSSAAAAAGPSARAGPLLPAYPRSMVVRPKAGTLLVAGEEEVVELAPAGGAPSLLARYPTASPGGAACVDPYGLALSADETTLWLACRQATLSMVRLRPAAGSRAGARHFSLELPNAAEAPRCAPAERGEAGQPGATKPQPISRRHRYLTGDPDFWAKISHAYACRYPDRVKLVQLGSSHQGRPLLALFISHDVRLSHDKPTVLLNGGHHGSELLSTTMAADAVATLLEDEGEALARYLDELTILVVPLVNPDGSWLAIHKGYKGRKNGRDSNGDGQRDGREGVDLNRNYPFRWGSLGEKGSSSKPNHPWYRGPGPGSEPETQAIMRLAGSEKLVAAISFHTGTVAICPPYTIPGVENPSPNEAWLVAEEIVKKLPAHPERYWDLRRNLYPLDGNDQDWHRFTHGTVALLVEGVDDEQGIGKDRMRAIQTVRSTWQLLLDRYLDGPSLYGRVTDAVGRPVVAEVTVAEIIYREGERWTSRCRDGRFDRYLAGPGRYTVRVTTSFAAPVEIPVDLSRPRRARVDVTVPAVLATSARCPTPSRAESHDGALVPLAP